jgi:hypothetical protein
MRGARGSAKGRRSYDQIRGRSLLPPTPPKSDNGVLRRRPALCDQHGICYYLQSEVVLVTFKKKERGRDLEWEVDDKRGEGWDSDPAKIHVATRMTSPFTASLTVTDISHKGTAKGATVSETREKEVESHVATHGLVWCQRRKVPCKLAFRSLCSSSCNLLQAST